MKYRKTNQSGFTLVEIAIVLVIIGILLAGVLRGQELINNARIKGLVSNINGVSSAYNSYLDRYQVIPGTETIATTNARGWTVVAGTGTGILTITPATTFAPTGIQNAFWQSLIQAGFFVGAPNLVANPPSSTGGLIGVSVGPYGLVQPAVCLSGLTTRQAAGVDAVIDGPGNTNNVGSLRGATGAANPLAPVAAAPGLTNYNEANVITTWSMCRSL